MTPPPPPPQFILGTTGFQSAAISHMPSNAEFVSRGLHTVASLTQLNTLASLYRGGAGNGNGNGSGAAAALTVAAAGAAAAIEEAGGTVGGIS